MQFIDWPLKKSECLLFLNGHPMPSVADLLGHIDAYHCIVAGDGAWNNLQHHDISVDRVMGDGDSIRQRPRQFVELASQDATDFEKIVLELIHQGIRSADIYWASGGEMDHFLGNLSVAAKYHQQITLFFYDAQQCYFYLTEDCCIQSASARLLTIYPFPNAIVSSQGLRYEMHHYEMHVATQQSLRNQIISERLTLAIEGAVFLFISR